MIDQARIADFSPQTYETLSQLKNKPQFEAFEALIEQKSFTNWKSAVFEAILKMKDSGYKINYPLMTFKKFIERAKYTDWPDAAYKNIFSLKARKQYLDYLEKYKILTAGERNLVVDQDSLNALIARYKVGSIEQLLPLLPPALRERYTLIWYSRSQQKADFQRPRVIMYSKDADCVLTFNDGNMHGSNKVHPKNETLCKSCHQQELRPNWDNYPYWMGAYGMIEDNMFEYPHILKRKDVPGPLPNTRYTDEATDEDFKAEDQMLSDLGANAAKIDMLSEFKNFQKLRPKHPRYKYLILDKDNPEYYPFGRDTFDLRYQPNLELGQLLFAWNLKRIANRYRNHIYEFAAHYLGCRFYTGEMTNLLARTLGIPNLEVTTLVFKHSSGYGNSGNVDHLGIEYLYELSQSDPEIKDILRGVSLRRTPGDPRYGNDISVLMNRLKEGRGDQVCHVLERRVKIR